MSMATMAGENETETTLPLRRDLPHRAVGQEVLVRDPETGKVHFLNATAGVVWECCDGRTSRRDCERRLREAFVMPDNIDLAADIRETLADFEQRGLIREPRADA
jgi:PqqD family protein of HPr-rel-A system